MITSIDFLTVCFPNDFQGDSRVVLAVSLWPGMTYGELKDEIECTSNQSDYGIDDWTGWETALDDWFESANLNSLVPDIKDFEFSDDYDGPYAYFAINQQTAPLLGTQLQLLDETATYGMRVCCVDAAKLVDLGALELPDLDENEWSEHIPAEAYDSEGDYISYGDLEINNPRLTRCYSHQIPVLELVGYSDYSGSLCDQSNYEVFETFLIENDLPYWQATGSHGTVALLVNWVALQNDELVEMIASLDGFLSLMRSTGSPLSQRHLTIKSSITLMTYKKGLKSGLRSTISMST